MLKFIKVRPGRYTCRNWWIEADVGARLRADQNSTPRASFWRAGVLGDNNPDNWSEFPTLGAAKDHVRAKLEA